MPEEQATSCADKAAVQDYAGHGTHVGSTVAAPINGDRHLGRRAQGNARRPARRHRERVLLHPAGRGRAHDRRGRAARRRQHVVLRRPVAVQLPQRRAAADDHRGDPSCVGLRRQAWRRTDRGGGQRVHRPDASEGRHDLARLPARLGGGAGRAPQLHRAAATSCRTSPTCRRSARWSSCRSTQTTAWARSPSARRAGRAGRRRTRTAATWPPTRRRPRSRRAATSTRPTRCSRRRPSRRGLRQQGGRPLRGLRLDPGHVDGVSARGRRRGADPGQAPGHERAGGHLDAVAHGDVAVVPERSRTRSSRSRRTSRQASSPRIARAAGETPRSTARG